MLSEGLFAHTLSDLFLWGKATHLGAPGHPHRDSWRRRCLRNTPSAGRSMACPDEFYHHCPPCTTRSPTRQNNHWNRAHNTEIIIRFLRSIHLKKFSTSRGKNTLSKFFCVFIFDEFRQELSSVSLTYIHKNSASSFIKCLSFSFSLPTHLCILCRLTKSSVWIKIDLCYVHYPLITTGWHSNIPIVVICCNSPCVSVACVCWYLAL